MGTCSKALLRAPLEGLRQKFGAQGACVILCQFSQKMMASRFLAFCTVLGWRQVADRLAGATELLGEKEERVAELEADVADLKVMYQEQVRLRPRHRGTDQEGTR